MNDMFDIFTSVEKKLKSAAQYTMIIDVVFAFFMIMGSAIVAGMGGFWTGILIALAYMSASVAKVQMLYGFAELITYTKDIRNSLQNNPEATSMIDELPEL